MDRLNTVIARCCAATIVFLGSVCLTSSEAQQPTSSAEFYSAGGDEIGKGRTFQYFNPGNQIVSQTIRDGSIRISIASPDSTPIWRLHFDAAGSTPIGNGFYRFAGLYPYYSSAGPSLSVERLFEGGGNCSGNLNGSFRIDGLETASYGEITKGYFAFEIACGGGVGTFRGQIIIGQGTPLYTSEAIRTGRPFALPFDAQIRTVTNSGTTQAFRYTHATHRILGGRNYGTHGAPAATGLYLGIANSNVPAWYMYFHPQPGTAITSGNYTQAGLYPYHASGPSIWVKSGPPPAYKDPYFDARGSFSVNYLTFSANNSVEKADIQFSFTRPDGVVLTEGSIVIGDSVTGNFAQGNGLYYSNGSAYCHWDDWQKFLRSNPGVNLNTVPKFLRIPSNLRFDGICAGAPIVGPFRVGGTINYSNGSAYCHVISMAAYWYYFPGIDPFSLPLLSSYPAGLRNDGYCTYANQPSGRLAVATPDGKGGIRLHDRNLPVTQTDHLMLMIEMYNIPGDARCYLENYDKPETVQREFETITIPIGQSTFYQTPRGTWGWGAFCKLPSGQEIWRDVVQVTG